MKDIRVRFAPSPTGPLHIGGVRTALYNYLFAKKLGGKFILRIEDTDQTRFVPSAEDYIIDALKWCGLEFDEGVHCGGDYGPYKQSERKEMYRQYADQLIENEHAYIAFDTAEELDLLRSSYETEGKTFTYNAEVRDGLNNSLSMDDSRCQYLMEEGVPYVIRFKMPADDELKMKDIIRGEINIKTSALDDKVLFKSDGMPTYHLANIVDDHLMKISHVIRGEEWLPSMPLHVMLYMALGWEDTMPEFAHLPLILKPKGNGKLSKRDGDKLGFPVFPTEWVNPTSGDKSMGYREEGYLPDAFNNIMVLLGWNPGTEQEIFTKEELISLFSLEKVHKAGARFDPEKAKWFNQQFIQRMDNKELAELYMPLLKEKGVSCELPMLETICSHVKDRVQFVNELWDQSYFFFEAPTEYDAKTVKKRWKGEVPQHMAAIKTLIEAESNFTSQHLEDVVKKWIEENEVGMGAIMNAFRLCIVGAGKGPHLFDIIEIIGKEESIKRLEAGIQNIKRD